MKLKNIAIYALLTGGLGLPVMTSGIALSHAAEGTAKGAQLVTFSPESPVSAWKATQVSAQKSKHPYCSVEARFQKSGATMVLARNKKGLNSLAIDFGKDIFEKGQTYEIQIGTDIGLQRRFEARALSATLLMAQIGRDKPFMRAISYNGEFTFFVPQAVRASFTLAGADNALERMERCLSTLEEFIPPLADETYLREAKAKVVKKRHSDSGSLVDEQVPSPTARMKVARNHTPDQVPVPPRKASGMNIKVTRVDAPVVYEDADVAENDTIAQPDMVDIARQEISERIDDLASRSTGPVEEHLSVTEKVIKAKPSEVKFSKNSPEEAPAKAEVEAVTEVAENVAEQVSLPQDEPVKAVEEAVAAVAVEKTGDDTTIVADVSQPTDETVPADDPLMMPMPGEAPAQIAMAEPEAGNASDGIIISVIKPEPIVWSAERAEIKDPAAKNIMALAKRSNESGAAETAITENKQMASAAGSLLPPPDLGDDLDVEGAYFPEQMAELPQGEIANAITVTVEKPVAGVADDMDTVDANTVATASLESVSGPFDAAEYQRLKQMAMAKHMAAKTQAEKDIAEPIDLAMASEVVATIAPAAGDDNETGGMLPAPQGVATGSPVTLSLSTTGTLSREDYIALKQGQKSMGEKAAVTLKQTSLSDAVAHIIPPQYQITVGNGVDMTQQVSWQDGDNWQDVIAAALGPIGVEAEIHGGVVMLMTMAR